MNKGITGILRDEKAMTLIELLVVCVIIGIAFLGLAGLFPLGTRNLSESRMRTIATDLAQEKLENLVNLNRNHTDLTAGTHNDPANPVRTTFNRFWSVADDTPVAGMKKIEVWVTYPRGSGTREIRAVTYRRS
jgi:prepilin-type N-terminal cleavage/methylation domain-containing protein